MTTVKVILIALALALVLAVAPAAAVQTYNVYEDIPLVPLSDTAFAFASSHTGIVVGTIQTGNNYNIQGILVTNDIAPKAIPNYVSKVYPDGKFSITLIPGSFTLHLIDGNGIETETIHATVSAGQISYPDKPFVGTPLGGA